MTIKIKNQESHYGKCPFCGYNNHHITVEYVDDGVYRPEIEAIVHCDLCGAMMSNIADTEDDAIQGAINKWRKRA